MPSRRTLLGFILGFNAAVFIAGAGFPVLAATPQSAEDFIRNLAGSALQTLGDRLPAPEQEKRFAALLDNNFDLPRISRFVLGRYWVTASDDDKQLFFKTFDAYVVRTYSNRFSSYSGQTVKVEGSRPEGENSYVVMSEIIDPDGGEPVKVDWHVREGEQGLRIIDVAVEGVSMVLTERQEFASVIERQGNGVPGLIAALQAKMSDTSTAQK